jgi:hypothetical protein
MGKGIREFRRATRELKSSVGLDELMKDEDLRELRNLGRGGLNTAPRRPAADPLRYELTDADHEREYPPEGVDLRHVADRANAPEDGETPAGPTVEPKSRSEGGD